MADYKAMYYYLAGRTVAGLETLDATIKSLKATTKALQDTTNAFEEISDKLKLAQQETEEMFISCDDEDDI